MISAISEDFRRKDRERAQALLDAFIKLVNSDQHDIISVGRDHACLMRDEIERLRRVEAESWGQSALVEAD